MKTSGWLLVVREPVSPPVKRFRSRSKRARMAEFSAALMIMLPVAISFLFVAIEATQIFLINSALNFSAAQAARQLALSYGQNPAAAAASPSNVFSQIKFLNIVQSSNQFSIPTGAAGWNTAAYPPTVTVQVTFKSGQNGCPVLPNPDPLMLSSRMVMTATATSRLE